MTFEWNPVEYERSSSAQARWAGEFIATIPFTGAEHVLDVGCGDGKVTAMLVEKVPQGGVLGVDSSAPMVALAAERFAALAPHLTFQVADASRLPFDAEFNVVFSNSTLHWIRDHGPVLRGIRNALKPGGRAYLRFGGKGSTTEVKAVLHDLIGRPEWMDYFEGFESPHGFYGPDEYIPWLETAGLKPERVELSPRVMRHGVDGLRGWVRTTKMPYTERVPEALRERFIDAVIAEFVKRYPADESGQYGVSMPRLDVVASRLGA